MNNTDTRMLAVQQAGFALYDAMLYLDTHPNNAEALRYYKQSREEYLNAKNAYECAFGPLLMYSAGGDESFNWLKTPWPWEAE